jgi:hypothetical protein
VPESLTVPGRFNGPVDSGNGGYSAGVVAGLLDGAAEVTLRSPVPLDASLEVVRDADGSVRLLADEELVIEARPVAELDLEVPAPVSPADARRAAERYRGQPGGMFSRCFVCGVDREDGLRVFAGQVEGREVVASPWTPPSWTADSDGSVRPEFVWAVLDCPTYFATYAGEQLPVSFLARFSARVETPVPVGEEHIVVSWPIEAEGRKRHAGAVVLSGDGAVLAVARALLIEPRSG